ncbi:UDP-N-acetylglucosamine 2-epimerase (non-hydrolyzing) [Oerskovia turbata]|uniref:UDP-N-acetylglucosamine 2-epimerase (non-hydrolyzing) n=1 Tax=Oerskovia turbata TaxID=1713 RepID=A0A4Q1L2U7_9CELL|nr:UDP-N-acetylglucosamine 2-epimerase (non-hydrolyzing) [Oerskovia turbata]RXR27164.1 UDP-N-acetylglucosamine 2-epimerase (non-hydrolyzing) [Oerskovia turbata]RXR36297.1 UDP-N-acetylglucosamine 2-epimerase (non-hydrolyzing) [Oerskovia turbata]TGJ98156.1 UDP-N-acetylglucosamine 2-epimerase (non-hydrolyzing) [Actinotalea fermentans ATCC 43279 = JCM 9966 = DSM 3133]
MTVYGTRPEAIKVAPVIKALEDSDDFESVTVVTGQHREMLDQVNELFGIVPDHDLNIMSHGQTLAQIFARVMDGLDPILEKEEPAAVIVQGDTSTSTAAALAAFYRRIPVIHLEAGLRSGDISSPFPEEANRRITTQIAALHLAPTETSRANLLAEGVDDSTIVVTGNTVIDALLMAASKRVPFTDPALEALAASGRKILLLTTHRRENWGSAMQGIGRALARIALEFPDVEIVLPLHRNPLVRDALLPALSGITNVTTTEPLSYGGFTRLMSLSHLIVTDSGGIQEEAPSLGKPVLVLRESTERPEGVAAGTTRLIGTRQEDVELQIRQVLSNPDTYAKMASSTNPYGNGDAAQSSLRAISLSARGTTDPSDGQPSDLHTTNK